PQPEREPAPFIGIDSTHPQYVWMDHAARAQLYPTAVLAHGATLAVADQATDVQLEAGLDERKKSGAQPHRHLAVKDRAEHGLHKIDQIGHRYVAVHHHAFHLIEGVLVGCVHFFVAEDAAGRDHAQRRTKLLHAAHLYR